MLRSATGSCAPSEGNLTNSKKCMTGFQGCDVLLKKEKNKNQKNFMVEVKLSVPQKVLFAKEQAGLADFKHHLA